MEKSKHFGGKTVVRVSYQKKWNIGKISEKISLKNKKKKIPDEFFI